jgi:soluble lytic murein transglycosylase-like protein
MAVSDYTTEINQAAAQYGLSPSLLAAVMQVESGGNPTAVSPANAQGLMQLMPATAASLGVTNTFDPTQNINAGASYLAQLINQYGGDVSTALAAYNWGPGNVNSGVAIPSSVQSYVSNVLAVAGTSNTSSGLTSDVLDQLNIAGVSLPSIDLSDPTTDILIGLGIAAVAFLFLR